MTHGNTEGIISESIHRLRLAIADSPRFQEMCGESSRLEAIKRVHGQDLPFEVDGNGEIPLHVLEKARPFAQVSMPDGGLNLIKDSSNGFGFGLTLNIAIESNLQPQLDDEAQDYYFTNAIGLIAVELMGVGSAARSVYPYGDIKSISVITAPFRSKRILSPALGDCFACVLAATFGTESSEG